MTDQLIEGRAPDTLHEAVEPTPEIARRNTRFAWALVALFLLLFCGTVLVGLTYLWVD